MRRLLFPILLVLSACGADADGDGAKAGVDCDDNDADVFPGAEEICDGKDNNCSGTIDENVTTTFYADVDNDGFGSPEPSFERCEAGTNEVEDNTDCDDSEADAYPGAEELCDGIDNDCDGEVDEGSTDAATWYRDSDGDTYGDDNDSLTACDPGDGWTLRGGDCDESRDDVNPGADEYCDEIDNDCDGDLDEDDAIDAPQWFADADSDGYGDAEASTYACEKPEGYVTTDSDCDDRDDTEFPGVLWYPDGDGDGYGDAEADPILCARNETSDRTNNTDCDDTRTDVNPGRPEIWYDGVDGNCDGASDFDQDKDGYDSAEYEGDDCDDSSPSVNPGATEVDDLVDNDCDGLCNEGFVSVGDIIVSEIMDDPSAVGDSSGEWFEVYNTTGADFAMCGWTISDLGGDSHDMTKTVVIAADSYAVFGIDDDTTVNGGVTLDYMYSSFNLANGDDEVILTFDGTEIDIVEYEEADFPDPTGASMNLDPDYLNRSDNDDYFNWCATDSASYGDGDLGSPGAANEECPE